MTLNATATERRQHLRAAIARMGDAIAVGEYTPSRPELDAVIELCRDHFLPTEAARVRAWIDQVCP